MMVRREAEGRNQGSFETDAEDFKEKFGWTPLWRDFERFAQEYTKDFMFYYSWWPEERLYPELPDIEF